MSQLNKIRSPYNNRTLYYEGSGTSFCCPIPSSVPICRRVWVEPDREVIQDPISWVDWTVFSDDVGLGFVGFDEEVAPYFSREAGIDFAKETKCLQRQLFLDLKPNVWRYDLPIPKEENYGGILGYFYGGVFRKHGLHCAIQSQLGSVQPHTNVIEFNRNLLLNPTGEILVVVWTTPNERSDVFDITLYDYYREQIVADARYRYARRFYYRDKELVSSVTAERQESIIKRAEAADSCRAWLINSREPQHDNQHLGFGLFQARSLCTRR